jgi:hypothetical protein
MNFNDIPDELYSDGNGLSDYLTANFNTEEDLGLFIDNSIDNVYTIGDVHGDFDLVKHIMTDVIKCIRINEDDVITWNSNIKNSYIVFLGDLIHSYRRVPNERTQFEVDPQNVDLKIFAFLKVCDCLSRKYECKVIMIVGNHEIYELFGQNVDEYMTSAEKYPNRQSDWNLTILNKKDNSYGSNWTKWYVKNTYLCVIINNIILSHAGVISDEIPLQIGNLIDINLALRQFVDPIDKQCIQFVNIPKNIIDQDKMIYINNFVSSRQLFDKDPRCGCDRYLSGIRKFYSNTLNKTRLKMPDDIGYKNIICVQGHNTKFFVEVQCDDKIFNIDVGMSRAYEYSMERFIDYIKEHFINYLKHVGIYTDEVRIEDLIDIASNNEDEHFSGLMDAYELFINSCIFRYSDCSRYRKPQCLRFDRLHPETANFTMNFGIMLKSREFITCLTDESNSFNRNYVGCNYGSFPLICRLLTILKQNVIDSDIIDIIDIQNKVDEQIVNDDETLLSLEEIKNIHI